MTSHGAVALAEMKDRALIGAVLTDWRTAPVKTAIRATLSFLETLTLRPEEVSTEAVLQMREAGVSDAGIEEAIAICMTFSIADRLADTFSFEVPDAAAAVKTGEMLLMRGYVQRSEGRDAAMSQSIHETIRRLRESVLTSDGVTSPEERQKIAGWSGHPEQGPASQQLPEPLATIITKVTLHAYKVTDEDIQTLRAAGYSEDAIFELVTSAAVGTAMRRYERGMAAITASD